MILCSVSNLSPYLIPAEIDFDPYISDLGHIGLPSIPPGDGNAVDYDEPSGDIHFLFAVIDCLEGWQKPCRLGPSCL